MWISNAFDRFINWWSPSRRRSNRKVYDVRSPEFHEEALKASGMEWDFSRLGDGRFMCCVKNCFSTRLYGNWTCQKHVAYEEKYFYPVDENGWLFWSHQ